MLNFLQRKKPVAPRAAPEGLRIYAVGDVHGRLDALDLLIRGMGDDFKGCEAQPVLVMLGDYVDRGPASREVIDRLIGLSQRPGLITRFIRGNHDEAMLRFAEGEAALGPSWNNFGAGDTLNSYGVQAPTPDEDAERWSEVQAAFAAALPAEHLAFLKGLEPFVEYGDYFFTHAGARPGYALDDQDEQDLMWIRDDFLKSSALFPKTVVHGHTPELEPTVNDRRIGVDTGAYATGRLTAVVLEGLERRLIQVQISGHAAEIEHLTLADLAERQTA